MKQRDKLRDLFLNYGNSEEILIREYAKAERRKEVSRSRNALGLTSEEYAKALISDARKKGWIKGF